MATPWEDSVKNRNPKQLTIFVAPTLSKPWRRAFDDALKTFNHLSQAHRLGVTMTAPANATKPEPDGDGGADVQFDTGSGDLAYTAFGQDFEVKNFSGRDMHGKTQLVVRQPQRIRRAFVFVPETPMVTAQMRVARDKFNDVQREAGHGIKHFIAAHELIHVCGLHNSDHTTYGPDADLLVAQPQPVSGPFNRPDEDKLMLHLATRPRPNVFAPPIFLKQATVDLIKDNWS